MTLKDDGGKMYVLAFWNISWDVRNLTGDGLAILRAAIAFKDWAGDVGFEVTDPDGKVISFEQLEERMGC